jgi:hypothetical protein
MSDHFDNEDARTDLTDLYVFAGAGTDRYVLVFDVNPEPSSWAINVDPSASYELKIDTDDDREADVAFHVGFSSDDDGMVATVYRAVGPAAREAGPVGEAVITGARVSIGEETVITEAGSLRFFAGPRSDPHFKDILGFRNDFQFTGNDPVAERNVFGVVLEMPRRMLGAEGPIRVWARTMALVDGELTQVDQAGRPGINNALITEDEDHDAFRRSSPADQRATFEEKFVVFLESLGYPAEEARAVGQSLLPDWLIYDADQPDGYPNGRRLTDDTADWLLSLLTHGRLTSDLAGPHTDLLVEFPYLGLPHLERLNALEPAKPV